MPDALNRSCQPVPVSEMRVLVTEAGGALGQALAKQLGATGGISVRLTDRPGAEVPTAVEAGDFHRCTFLPDEGTDALVAGVDMMVSGNRRLVPRCVLQVKSVTE